MTVEGGMGEGSIMNGGMKGEFDECEGEAMKGKPS